jgi:class III poly(R)-hydroxyalkanoic acid synthase PhaE subunit
MKKEKNENSALDSLLSTGMKASEDFWKTAAKIWPASVDALSGQPGRVGKEGADLQGPWTAFQEMWESYFALLAKGTGQGGGQKQVGMLPDIMMKAFQPLWGGASLLQRQWSEVQKGSVPEAGNDDMGELAERMGKTWIETYAEEFRKILNIPQLGLTRFYQERANLTVDKFTHFQSAISDFIGVLLKPMSVVFQEMQQEAKTMNEQGEEMLQDSKAYYNIWMKKMEQRYLDLLRSPEYTESLKNTVMALKDFRMARQQYLIDLLQDIPVPTHKEMDEVYKDLYELKKRLRRLEKKEAGHENR